MQRLVLLTIILQGATALVIENHNTEERAIAGIVQKQGDGADTATQDSLETTQPVFYAIIMGRLAFRHQVSLWLSSLRTLGKWVGVAVIVTDRPSCLSNTLKEAGLLGQQLSSDDSVDIYGPTEGGRGNLHIVKRPLAKTVNQMKFEKSRAWFNIKAAKIPAPVSSIIYTDEDVVIGRSLWEFTSHIRGLEQQGHTLALFRDTGTSAGELHTGVVVMFKGDATNECLQAWGKKLLGTTQASEMNGVNATVLETKNSLAKKLVSLDGQEQALNEDSSVADQLLDESLDESLHSMGPDQQALGKTKPCKKGINSRGIKLLPAQFLWMPTIEGMTQAKPFRSEFMHFTNTNRWQQLKGNMKKYLAKIGIPKGIDPTGKLKNLECAIPEGGTIEDVNKGPTKYK